MLRRGRKTALDRQLKREARATAYASLSPRDRLRKRVGWPLCAVGAGLFLATLVANFAGTNLLPFDQHHVVGQFGGGLLTVTGLAWATR